MSCNCFICHEISHDFCGCCETIKIEMTSGSLIEPIARLSDEKLKAKNQQLEAENVKLKAEVKDILLRMVDSNTKRAHEILDLIEAREKLKEENEKLKAENANLKEENEHIRDLYQEICDIPTIKKLKKDKKELEFDKVALKAEIEKLNNKLRIATTIIDDYGKELEQAHKRAAELKQANSELASAAISSYDCNTCKDSKTITSTKIGNIGVRRMVIDCPDCMPMPEERCQCDYCIDIRNQMNLIKRLLERDRRKDAL
jgi:cell division protein FtsB